MTAKLHPTLYPLPIIGWREDIQLPEFSDDIFIAKIDTGARSAALHAEDILVVGKKVHFALPVQGQLKQFSVEHHGIKRVKSSNGFSELRPLINAIVKVGMHRFEIEITLTNRTDMEVPMLLGRNAIKGRFLVNPQRSFTLSRRKKTRA